MIENSIGPGTDAYKSSYYSVSAYDGSSFVSSYVYSFGGVSAWCSPSVSGGNRNQFWSHGDEPNIAYLTIGLASSTEIKVEKIGSPISSVFIGPRSKNTPYTLSGGILTFTLEQPNKHFLILNNDTSNTLCIFGDPLKPSLPAVYTPFGSGDGSCIYFGSGVHDIGLAFSAISSTYFNNKTFYFDQGSYVKGSFYIPSGNNIRFIGPGILSCEDWYDECAAIKDNPSSSAEVLLDGLYLPIFGRFLYEQHLNVNFPYGVEISGLTVVYNPWHGPKGINTFTNYKQINPCRYSTDGPHPIPDNITKLCTVKNSFIFNGDDCAYGTSFNSIGSTLYENNYFVTNINSAYTLGYENSFNGFLNIYGVSALNTDIYYFDTDRFSASNSGLRYTNSIIRMHLGTTTSANIIPGLWGVYNVLISGVHFDNNIEVPLFTLMNSLDPWSNSINRVLSGCASGLRFRDFNVSTTSNRIFGNIISGLNSTYEITDVEFTNINVNGTYVTFTNHTNYFIIEGSTDVIQDRIFFYSPEELIFQFKIPISFVQLLS